MEIKLLALLSILGSFYLSEGYKILVVFALPGKSHSILGDGYVRHLLEAGHEVTYVTPFPKNHTNPKYREIDVSETIDALDFESFTIKKVIDKEVEMTNPITLFDLMIGCFKVALESKNMQQLINDPTEKFDAVIVEYMFSDLFAGLSTVFDCPLIWSSSLEPHWIILKLIHEGHNPAYVPDIQSTDIPPLTFVQRVKGLFFVGIYNLLKHFYSLPTEKELFERNFGPAVARKGRVLPDYQDVAHNGSFILANSHVSLSQPLSLPPNAKEIGGYHIDSKVKPLPKELQELMDNAKHGVVYFSMGSNFKSKDIPDVIKKDILKVLGELKQTVLWKFEEDLPNLPKNVHILKWAPQPSILAHPNTRLFITHGGLLSTTETVHFGVPIIAIPISADQYINANRAVSKGLALKVDLSYDMGEPLRAALEEALSTNKFLERAKELSQIYHDRPVSPGKELVHWVEHVVKTRGAPHLRSPALMTPWYQKMYLDLVAVIFVSLMLIKLLIKRIFKLGKRVDSKKKLN